MDRDERRWRRAVDAVAYEESLGAEYLGTCGDAGGMSERDGRYVACSRQAGQGTEHPGWGRCASHGGNGRAETMKAVVMMGHALGRELNTTPMDAMLRSVRVAAGQAAWYDSKVAEAPDDDAVAPGGSHWHWVQGSERAHRAAVSYSAIAIRAGIAKLIVEQAQDEARLVFSAFAPLLDLLERYAPPEVVRQARSELRQRILELGTADLGRSPTAELERGPEEV